MFISDNKSKSGHKDATLSWQRHPCREFTLWFISLSSTRITVAFQSSKEVCCSVAVNLHLAPSPSRLCCFWKLKPPQNHFLFFHVENKKKKRLQRANNNRGVLVVPAFFFNRQLPQIINDSKVEEGTPDVHGSANLSRRWTLGKVPQEKHLNRLRTAKMSKVSGGARQHYLILFRT